MNIILTVSLFVIFVYILYLRAKVREFDSIYEEVLKCINSVNDRINANDEELFKYLNSVNDLVKSNNEDITELYNKIEVLESTTSNDD